MPKCVCLGATGQIMNTQFEKSDVVPHSNPLIVCALIFYIRALRKDEVQSAFIRHLIFLFQGH